MPTLASPAMLFFYCVFLLSNCAHIVQTREEYVVAGEEPVVNGARLSAEMLTTDGEVKYSLSAMVYFAAGEAETGPYKCLLTAWGDRGSHRAMTVERLTVRAEGREESVPASRRISFAAGSNDQGWQATYIIPGVLSLDYEAGSDVVLDARIRIHKSRGSVARNVSIRLQPAPEKDVKFATIIDEFRKGRDEFDSADF